MVSQIVKRCLMMVSVLFAGMPIVHAQSQATAAGAVPNQTTVHSNVVPAQENRFITISDYNKTLDQWIAEANVSVERQHELLNSDVIILPPDRWTVLPPEYWTFALWGVGFKNYCKDRSLTVDICSKDDNVVMETQNSGIYLGPFFLPVIKSGIVNVFWGLISNFIYGQFKPDHSEDEYHSATFSIIMEENGKRKEVRYDGPVSEIDKVGEIIKSMANETPEQGTVHPD